MIHRGDCVALPTSVILTKLAFAIQSDFTLRMPKLSQALDSVFLNFFVFVLLSFRSLFLALSRRECSCVALNFVCVKAQCDAL